jgi:hypothetical protein
MWSCWMMCSVALNMRLGLYNQDGKVVCSIYRVTKRSGICFAVELEAWSL